MKKIILILMLSLSSISIYNQTISPFNKCVKRCDEDFKSEMLKLNIALGISQVTFFAQIAYCEGGTLTLATPACITAFIIEEVGALSIYGIFVIVEYKDFQICKKRCKEDFNSTGDAGNNGTEVGPGNNTENGPWKNQGWKPGGLIFGTGTGGSISSWGSNNPGYNPASSAGGGSCKPVETIMWDDNGYWDNCLTYHAWVV